MTKGHTIEINVKEELNYNANNHLHVIKNNNKTQR